MKIKSLLAGLLVMLALAGAVGAAIESTITKTVTVNTNAADFTVVATAANRTIRVTHLDAQNVGTANKVAVKFCDGPCASATSIIGPFELSPASASAMGGGYSFVCSGPNCAWVITAGNALIAQVDTGATNNVRVHVTYQYYQR